MKVKTVRPVHTAAHGVVPAGTEIEVSADLAQILKERGFVEAEAADYDTKVVNRKPRKRG